MLSIFQPASLLISIDVPSALEMTGLLELFGGYDIAATWNLAELEQTSLISRIRSANAQHEIGILATDAWVGPQIGRGHFAVELQYRIDLASSADCQTLVMASEDLPAASHYDLLIKHGISAIIRTSNDTKAEGQPRQLRYGLWQIDSNVRLAHQGSSWLRGEERRVRKVIHAIVTKNSAKNAAIKQPATCHLSIDASALDSQYRVIQRTLHYIDQLCRSGSLQITTVGQIARQLSRPAIPTRSANSILRRAA